MFVGVNGAGKTTVIDAVSAGFFGLLLDVVGENLSYAQNHLDRRNINKRALALRKPFASVSLELEFQSAPMHISFAIGEAFEDPTGMKTGHFEQDVYCEPWNSAFAAATLGKDAVIPLLAHYPVERLVIEPSLEISQTGQGNQFDAFSEFGAKKIDFDNFFEWFRSTEDQENEIRLNKDNSYSDPGLAAVRAAILSFLEGFTKMRVKRTEGVTLILEKQGEEFNIGQLSHGEKAMIAIVGDLARRMVLTNPGQKDPLNGTGIVLIDEIDLHLHPKWQRTILQKLQNSFPNIQFICTTHSPLIVSQLKPESVFMLDSGYCYNLKDRFSEFNSYAASVEDIMSIVQGVDQFIPDDVKVEIDRLHKALNEGHTNLAKTLVAKLVKVVGKEQPDLRKVAVQLRYNDLLRESE